MHEFGVFIGRFQPFHNAHLSMVKFAFQRVKHLIIVIGSDNQARNVKNPWTTAERIAMIEDCLSTEELMKTSFVPAKDYLYNDNTWISEVQRLVKAITNVSSDIALIGNRKDALARFYANPFPQWAFIDTGPMLSDINASKVRSLMFTQDKIGTHDIVPPNIHKVLLAFMETPEFTRLHEEYHHILDYRAQWDHAPFPPTFNTVDAVVLCSGHVLVVRRKGAPGRGLIALPGGYLNAHERIIDGCLRELKEETGIKLPIHELRKCVVDEKVFDHPMRSLRGRTITHAFCFDLGRGELPQVKGMDDADKAWWMPLSDVHAKESSFFDDHYHIVNYFANRS